MITFAYPFAFLLLFLPFALYFLLPAVKGLHGDGLKVPFINDLKRIAVASGGLWSGVAQASKGVSKNFVWLMIVWTLLCLAVARPIKVGEPVRLQNQSRDIMLVLDISTSMLEPDFALSGKRISRLDAVKRVVADFVAKRADDRVGLILFGTRAYLQAPLTFDKAGVKDILFSMQAGMAGDSTSIGDAIALALKNLRNAPQGAEKVITLLTDGENNDGSLNLAQAIKLAADENIKVYTVGVGTSNAFFKMLSFTSGVDEEGLRALAQITKGRYFRAESTSELQKVYTLIDKLEASVGDERYIRETTEFYYIPLLLAIVLALGLAFIWRRVG